MSVDQEELKPIPFTPRERALVAEYGQGIERLKKSLSDLCTCIVERSGRPTIHYEIREDGLYPQLGEKRDV